VGVPGRRGGRGARNGEKTFFWRKREMYTLVFFPRWGLVLTTENKEGKGLLSGLPEGMYSFRPKIPIWVNFGGSCNERCWYILQTRGLFYVIFYGNLVCFPVLVCCMYQQRSGIPTCCTYSTYTM
jgi:hypothetical protein